MTVPSLHLTLVGKGKQIVRAIEHARGGVVGIHVERTENHPELPVPMRTPYRVMWLKARLTDPEATKAADEIYETFLPHWLSAGLQAIKSKGSLLPIHKAWEQWAQNQVVEPLILQLLKRRGITVTPGGSTTNSVITSQAALSSLLDTSFRCDFPPGLNVRGSDLFV